MRVHYYLPCDEVQMYSDSDCAGNINDWNSTSGYVLLSGGAAVTRSSRKQPIVTISITEAEFIAAAMTACQVLPNYDQKDLAANRAYNGRYCVYQL